MRREVDDAMRATTEQLSQVTEPAGAGVRAADRDGHDPPRRGAAAAAPGGDGGGHHLHRRRHQARDLLRRAAGPGLVEWAGQLPQRGARRHGRGRADAARPSSPTRSSAQREREFLDTLAPAFTELEDTAGDTLFVDGAARLLVRAPLPGAAPALRPDGRAGAARGAARRCCGRRWPSPASTCASGARTPAPELRSLSMVAANYGVARRNLGAVERARPDAHGLPAARSSPCARRPPSCRASWARSTTSEARRLRGARRRARRRRARDQEGLPRAGARAAPRREPRRPRGRGEVQGGRRGLRGAVGPRAPRGLRPLRLGRPRLARLRARRRTASAPSRDIFDAFFGGDPFGGGAAAARARVQGGDMGVEVEITLEQAARGATVEVAYDAVAPCERCHGNRAEPGTPIETCERCGGSRAAAGGDPHGVRPDGARPGLRRLRRRGQGGRARRARECGGRGQQAVRARRSTWTSRRASPTSSASASPAAATRASAAGPPGDLYVLVRVAEDERFLRDGSDLVTVVDVPAPAAALGTTVTRAHAGRRGGDRGRRRAPSPAPW